MGEADHSHGPGPGDDDAAVRAPWWRRPVPLWVLAVLAMAGVASVAALGGQLVDRDDEITSLESQLAAADRAHARADDRADELAEELADTRAALEDAEAEALAAAEAALAERVAEVDERAGALDEREAALAERESQLDATLNGLRASEFSDGVHEVGRDIQPGRYHTDGGGGGRCYYALLGPDGRDILDNNIVNGPATVIIDSAFFESTRCGTWTKIG